MQPTESAKKRYARVLGLMNTLEDLQHEDRIDPLHLKRTVRLATYDNAFTLGIASVFSEFEKRLPLVRFHVTQADEHLFDDLRANRLDLVFFARQGLHPQLRSIPLVTEPYVCVVRKGHPLTKKAVKFGSLDKADLDPWRQVLINAQPDRYRAPNSPANGWFNPTDPEKIALVVPFFLSVPLCLYETDCYAIVPKATAEMAFDGRKLDFLPITDKAPKLTVYMGWHVRTHTDPGMQIIRSTLKELVSGKLGQEK
jgi:DNA-binding transcriptional LysR family regulator